MKWSQNKKISTPADLSSAGPKTQHGPFLNVFNRSQSSTSDKTFHLHTYKVQAGQEQIRTCRSRMIEPSGRFVLVTKLRMGLPMVGWLCREFNCADRSSLSNFAAVYLCFRADFSIVDLDKKGYQKRQVTSGWLFLLSESPLSETGFAILVQSRTPRLNNRPPPFRFAILTLNKIFHSGNSTHIATVQYCMSTLNFVCSFIRPVKM